GRAARYHPVRALARCAGRSRRGRSRARRHRSRRHRGRPSARPAHRPARGDLDPGQRAPPPPAPARRQRLGTARRLQRLKLPVGAALAPRPAMTPILLSWSAGKDAAWTLHVLRQRSDVEVVGLLTTLTEGYGRVAMQGIRHDVLLAQANAIGLPLIEAWMPQAADNAAYERSFADALARARERWPGLDRIAFGDLLLAD